jgi:acetylornithine deacetylase/succinyl-diaminopimelate desuccinylase-like protein
MTTATAPALDWTSIENTALGRFQDLLRIDTTNPPGNEIVACRYLEKLLGEAGVESRILEPKPTRGNLIARLKGDGSKKPLLLTAHLDVVLAEPDQWQVPPFAGTVKDGYLWGRGTIDMKNMAIYNLTTFLLLKQLGVKLQRDVILCFVADEEAGCTEGMEFLAKNHPELIAAEYALNEVGGFTIHAGATRLYPIQVEEKGFVWLKMKVKGDPGHGSMPHKNNAVGHLARAVDKIDRRLLPLHVSDVVATFIAELGKGMGFPTSLILKQTLNPLVSDLLLQKVVPDEQARPLRAMLHNTVNPTGLIAGEKVNVIPSEATAVLDCRILPGTTPESFLAELRGLVGDAFEFEIIKAAPASTAPIGTPLYNKLAQVLERRDPGAKAIPYLTVGFTDSKYLEPLGVKAYGFSPIKLPPELPFAPMFHGHNERLPVDGFTWGLRTHFEAVWEFLTEDR